MGSGFGTGGKRGVAGGDGVVTVDGVSGVCGVGGITINIGECKEISFKDHTNLTSSSIVIIYITRKQQCAELSAQCIPSRPGADGKQCGLTDLHFGHPRLPTYKPTIPSSLVLLVLVVLVDQAVVVSPNLAVVGSPYLAVDGVAAHLGQAFPHPHPYHQIDFGMRPYLAMMAWNILHLHHSDPLDSPSLFDYLSNLAFRYSHINIYVGY